MGKVNRIFFPRSFLHPLSWVQGSGYRQGSQSGCPGRSASNSPSGSSWSSPASHDCTGSSSSVCACARSAANDARQCHRRVSARPAAAAFHGARARPRVRARRRMKARALGLNRPPTSMPKTTNRQRPCPPARNSGYVRCLRASAWRSAQPGSTSAPGRGSPHLCSGLTSVVSTAIWAPRHRGRPLATTSMRRPSVTVTFKCAKGREFIVFVFAS